MIAIQPLLQGLCFCITILLYSSLCAQETLPIELFPEKDLNRSTLGLNAFANQSEFGTPAMQFQEANEILGVTHFRLLFAWSNEVQATSASKLDFSFYDTLIKDLPRGSRVRIVIANLPDWMHQAQHWQRDDPVFTLYRRWLRKVILRYRRKRKVIGFQIWNEPNDAGNPENLTLDFVDHPERYIALVQRCNRLMKRRARRKLVVGAATTSIIQNFPETLEYNKALRDAGLEQYIDEWAFHVYGSSHERFYLGVLEFLESIEKPLVVTESGAEGVFEQASYVRQVWPFLSESLPSIRRFYFYRFADTRSPDSTFGLKNTSADFPVSDLYIYLRDDLP